MNVSELLFERGQSIWYDNIERRLLENGEMAGMISEKKIFGITSNPSIFEKAIGSSKDYDNSLQAMAWAGLTTDQTYTQLVVEDIQKAADLFEPVFQATHGTDGMVSLEVSPLLANDTQSTINEAQALWARVNRKNLLVKVPATKAGIPAIRELISKGININVTLIFSNDRYREVMEAYLSGLEKRLAEKLPIKDIVSVASFFVSRIDSMVDKKLEEIISVDTQKSEAARQLLGKTAVNNAKMAYQAFQEVFNSERFNRLAEEGARKQRPLWASTGTKNPKYSDTVYVDSLIASNSVNTVPPDTIRALLDHGQSSISIEEGLAEAREQLAQLEYLGINLAQVTQDLENDGVDKFAKAFQSLNSTIDAKRIHFQAELGELTLPVQQAVKNAASEDYVGRLFQHDPTLWTDQEKDFDEIRNRLGWLGLPGKQLPLIEELRNFRHSCLKDGFTHVFVLGMGGSSLAPEVLSLAIAPTLPAGSGLILQIIDTTNPDEILSRIYGIDLRKCLFVVSSKSGTTSETNAAFLYFWHELEVKGVKEAGRQFVAITDPGTPLETLAKEKHFRKIFSAQADVGGRYSVFTLFGLVPAALMGIDLEILLKRAEIFDQKSEEIVPYPTNPNLMLGLVLGEAANIGKNKLTFISEGFAGSLVPWLEQLIAESSGKEGKGILPIADEPISDTLAYGSDRIFVYLVVDGNKQGLVEKLKENGHPVIEIQLRDPYDLGGEFYRWEYATAIACVKLHVNAFNQPNVQDNKAITKTKIAEYQALGSLQEGEPIWENDQAAIYGASAPGLSVAKKLNEAVSLYLGKVLNHGYVVLSAYVARSPESISSLQLVRNRIGKKTNVANTLGFGPRFLHSTGQLHKGGLSGGLFIILTKDPEQDLEIPTEKMTFGTLQKAQSLGDLEALLQRGRTAIRIHFRNGTFEDLV